MWLSNSSRHKVLPGGVGDPGSVRTPGSVNDQVLVDWLSSTIQYLIRCPDQPRT